MNISVVDCNDKILQVGDLVLRTIYSNITFHRITKINRKSIKLTCGRREIFYGSNNNSYTIAYPAKKIEDVDTIDCTNGPDICIHSWLPNKNNSLFKINE